jgi:hypothetical protein
VVIEDTPSQPVQAVPSAPPSELPEYFKELEGDSDPFADSDDFFPKLEISTDEAISRVQQLREYIQQGMKDGVDYGLIPGTNTNKPSLFKPGAEKLCLIYGLSARVAELKSIEDFEVGIFSYVVKVSLVQKRTGTVVAEGVGQCNSRERRYKNQDPASVANTILKMARKRALVDATISATCASDEFTQDIEDSSPDSVPSNNGQAAQQQQQQRQQVQHTQYPPQNGAQNGAQQQLGRNGLQSQQPQQQQQRPPAQSPPPARTGPIHGSSLYIQAVQAVENGFAPECHVCGGEMRDYRANKRNPNGPDFVCANRECKQPNGYTTSIFPPRDSQN